MYTVVCESQVLPTPSVQLVVTTTDNIFKRTISWVPQALCVYCLDTKYEVHLGLNKSNYFNDFSSFTLMTLTGSNEYTLLSEHWHGLMTPRYGLMTNPIWSNYFGRHVHTSFIVSRCNYSIKIFPWATNKNTS